MERPFPIDYPRGEFGHHSGQQWGVGTLESALNYVKALSLGEFSKHRSLAFYSLEGRRLLPPESMAGAREYTA